MHLLMPFVLFLSCVSTHFAYAISPSPTTPHAPVHAIVPTVTGQIGINPVDLPPAASIIAPIGVDTNYLTQHVTDSLTITKWVAATTDFGTATINVTTGGAVQQTTIPDGFKVVNTTTGGLEIAFSPYIKEIIAKYLPQLPRCNALALADAARKDEEVASNNTERRPRLMQKRTPPATACARRRGGRLSQLLSEDAEWVQQGQRLNQEVALATGNDVAALESSGQALGIIEEDAVAELILEEMAVTAAQRSLAAAFGTFFEILSGVAFLYAVYEIGLGLWKIQANTQPMPIFTPTRTAEVSATATPSSCPTASIPCIGERCQGSPDGTCSAEDFYGCPCAVSGSTIGDMTLWGAEYDDILNLISQYQIPGPYEPQCAAYTLDDVVSIEDDPWNRDFDLFCSITRETDPYGIESGWDSCIHNSLAPDVHFKFYYNSTFTCRIPCRDAFNGLRDHCSYDSHTKFKEGYTETACGLAAYVIEPC